MHVSLFQKINIREYKKDEKGGKGKKGLSLLVWLKGRSEVPLVWLARGGEGK